MTTADKVLSELNGEFLKKHPREAAEFIESIENEAGVKLLIQSDLEAQCEVFKNILVIVAEEIIECMPGQNIEKLFGHFDPKEAAILLSRFAPDLQKKCLELIEKDIKKEIKEHMDYPYDSAGHLMDTRVLTFRDNETISSVIKKLRERKFNSINNLLIVDEDMKLVSRVDLQKIIFADDKDTLSMIATPIKAYSLVLDTRSDVVEVLEKYKVKELPVVDINGRLRGIIRGAELIDAMKEEVLADMQAMVGASKDERALSPAFFSIKKRLPWLHVNLLTAFLAASVVGLFEGTIAKYTALAVLLPVVAGQAGNAGAQALAVTMRGIALREISIKQWFQVMFKEFKVGAFSGFAIAIATSVGVFAWSRNLGLTFLLFISMVISMVVACVSGSLVPIILKRFGQDPAQSSSIVLTTITDVAGFFTFLGIATMLGDMLG